jgi:transposase InsO family protein
MTQVLHTMARTTHHDRAEIQQSNLSQRKLASQFGVTRSTIIKWQNRDTVEDRSHCPHTLHTTLSSDQEAVVIALRTTLFLPLDDLLTITREFINSKVSRSGLLRCLKRHKVSNLRALQNALTDENSSSLSSKAKTFNNYEPGFLHIDIKYLPQMPDENQRRYLFVAIDRATRWVFIKIYADQSQDSSVDFLKQVQKHCPVHIQKILTDNGTQFTDRFNSKVKEPSGKHAFDQACQAIGAEHRLIPPRKPQTNGMVERFNGRISEVIKQTRFASAKDLEDTLMNYTRIYNEHIPQRALNHLSPLQSLQNWQTKKPKLFKISVPNHAGLDIYPIV